jgi:hydrogenase expression/formation protein HypC
MCVAVPGKIIEINGDIAKVDVLNNICEANVKLVEAGVGDYILIHAGFALEVMKKDMAEELIGIFEELEEDQNEDSRTGKG